MIDVVTTEPIFTVPFLHLRVDDWGEKREDILKLCIDKNLELRKDKDDFVNSDYHLLTDNKLPNYSERVGEILKQEIKTFNEIFNVNYKIKDAWFEKASKEQHHAVHNHGMTGFSSVCFVALATRKNPAVTIITERLIPFFSTISPPPCFSLFFCVNMYIATATNKTIIPRY